MASFLWKMVSRGKPKNKSLSKALIPALFMHKLSTDTNIKSENIAKGIELRFPVNYNNREDKPLAVIFCWMLAKKKHVDKYGDFYIHKGCDVLNVRIKPWELILPTLGSQVLAQNVLTFIQKTPKYPKILVHGFSVGGYMYGECLIKMINNPQFQGISQRIVGQIFDSAVDFDLIPKGLAGAIFDNPVMINIFKAFMDNYLKLTYSFSSKHHLRSSATFHKNPVNCPSLFLYSRDDTIGSAEGNERVIRNWELMGHRVYYKCWDSSPHVSHYHKHTDEYLATLNTFLEQLEIFGPEPTQEIKYKQSQKL